MATQGQVITCKGTTPLSILPLSVFMDYVWPESEMAMVIFVLGNLKRRWPGNPTSPWSSKTYRWLRRKPERSGSRFSSPLYATPMLILGAARSSLLFFFNISVPFSLVYIYIYIYMLSRKFFKMFSTIILMKACNQLSEYFVCQDIVALFYFIFFCFVFGWVVMTHFWSNGKHSNC